MIKEVDVLGRRITINHISKAEMIRHMAEDPTLKDDTVLLGYYSPTEKAIYIQSGLEGLVYQETLTHEIGHAGTDVCGLANILDPNTEEAVCDLMASVMVPLFRNKKFVEAMQE
jgi:hypothetical protein